ncbi:FAD-dependent oxidoreductase [Metabacillus indicus]|uniref:FAD-dependent oxidoreductase n=1 Tax=Metabacillus indicus TaxID=246786 RepID=UPI003CF18221
MKNTNSKLPRFPEPYWRDTSNLPAFPKLSKHITVDAAVVGGGITGITSAYLLAKEGLKVALIDSDCLLNGTTGHTTAKVTIQHDLIYHELIQHAGKDGAKHYYEANQAGLDFIRNTVKEKNIPCDFSNQDAVLYAVSDESLDKLLKEKDAYDAIGIPYEFIEKLPLNIDIKGALLVKNQAQFHPLNYLHALLDEMMQSGVQIYENTSIIDVKGTKEEPVLLSNEGFEITSGHVIAATHFPFYDGNGFYFARMYADRSYVISAKTSKPYPGGMYLSVDEPKRSLRSVSYSGQDVVLIGGEGHKAGQEKDTHKLYEKLGGFGEEIFGLEEITHRWSAQDLFTLDKIPYIGPLTSSNPNIYAATGFHKWGMTNGTFAAHMLRDLIVKKESRYLDLFTPSRFHSDPGVKEFLKANADVAKHLIAGKIKRPSKSPEDLHPDEGCAVMVNGKKAGGYKDEHGVLHFVDMTCTHLGCEVEWNSGDRSWDCPCHGSRFSYKGDVIEGPADKPLKVIKEE